jgi:RNA-binding protein
MDKGYTIQDFISYSLVSITLKKRKASLISMKYANRIVLTVFAKPEEGEAKIKETLIRLVPFSLEEEKITLRRSSAQGFNEKKIILYEIALEKESHTNAFIRQLKEKLNDEQRDMLVRQENRLDEECCYYLRLDKQKLIDGQYWLTDSGDCFHMKFCIAAFPKKRECAKEVVKKIFSPS